MTRRHLTRRQFLTGAAGVGVGAIASGGMAGRAFGSVALGDGAASGLIARPPVPANFRSYISRPDISPPGISVSAVPGFASQTGLPKYIFVTPRPNVGGTMPPHAQQGLMILDLEGRLVWWQQQSNALHNPFNLRVQRYHGEDVLTYFSGSAPAGVGLSGAYALLDSTYTTIHQVSAHTYPSDLHEFLLTSDDTALLTAYESTGTNGDGPLISHAQEIDVATGELRYDWSSRGVATSESYVSQPAGKPWDYFHINSIDLWPGSARNLLISGRNTSAVYLVDRATGGIIWRLGGKRSDFAVPADAGFAFQHDARPLADGSGLSLFDDQSAVPGRYASGKVLNLDTSTRKASLRHSYFHTTAQVNSPYTGNTQLLPTGGHFVDFGGTPYFTVFGPSGSAVDAPIVFDARFPTGVFTYRSYMADWVGYPPVSQIGFVVVTNAGTGQFTAHCSWNGATEIASWLVEAGPTSSTMRPDAVVARQGFETAVPIAHVGARYFQATALDAGGNALGSSKVVEL